jgi:sulfate transport system permease protein
VNTVFGIVCALAIVRKRFWGKGLLNAFIDLPLALSPVVVGLASSSCTETTAGSAAGSSEHGIQVPLRTSRDGDRHDLRLAARSSRARSCRRCARSATSRSRRRSRSARAGGRRSGGSPLPVDPLGGDLRRRSSPPHAASASTAPSPVVSGRLQGETETATLRVQERWEAFDVAGAYAISIVLAMIAILVLVAMTAIRPREERA